jgi:hypothetical protein
MFTLASLLLAVGVSACFTEQALDDTGLAESTSGDGGCTPGALGCDCYGNATCDPMLECAAPTGTCVPTGCAPGEVHCLCDHDSCEEPLLCVAGICAAPSDSSGGTDSSSGSADTSSGASTVTTTADSSGDATSAGPTSTDADETGSSSDTGSLVVCDDLDCEACVDCVIEDGQPCAALAETCEGAPGCDGAAACMAYCGVTGLCLDDCCAMASPGARAAALALNECRSSSCATACFDYQAPVCVG